MNLQNRSDLPENMYWEDSDLSGAESTRAQAAAHPANGESFNVSQTWTSRVGQGDGLQWPRGSQQHDVDYILHGRLQTLPPARSRVVRVFLSSTFTDMSVERNTLMKTTFPKLKAFLRDKYDLEFQVVDMRWGVRHDAVDDHSSSQLCMRELSMCKKLSIGPTFVTFIGQRYGSRPLPAKICQDEMKQMLEYLTGSEKDVTVEDVELVQAWYREDANAVPPHYVLQPISTMAQAHNSKAQTSIEPQDLWKQCEPMLASTLRKAAKALQSQSVFTTQVAQKYLQSVTDEEIVKGLLEDPDPDAHCLCFVRTLDNINLLHDKAWRFIDQTKAGQVDTEAQGYLNELKDVKIPACLSEQNMFHFHVPWSDNGGVNEEEQREYLEKFCQTFETSLMRLVLQGIKKTENVASDQLYVEVLEHAHQCANKCERFFGRDAILSHIKAYIMSDSIHPLVIEGESGCGKTSVMAKAAKMTPEWLGDDKNLTVVLRFLGTTPFTSDIGTTLTSLCQQVYRAVPMSEEYRDVPPQFADLKEFFWDMLEDISEDKLLVIFLDSLDQLSSADNAYAVKWLPSKLPARVKIILSTLPFEHGILNNLEQLGYDSHNFLTVGDLETADSIAILKLWLQQQQRNITEEQLKALESTLLEKQRPLYLKLILDQVLTWKSYQQVSEIQNLPRSITDAIQQLFDSLEYKHGLKLVSRAFAYLTASKNGLTETEMEDILSMDDDVLKDVFEFHVPPVRRLPSILWSRIRGDISEYIVDREADGAKVMAWYHRQFIENASRYFVRQDNRWSSWKDSFKNTKDDCEIVMQNIFDYFHGTFSNGKEKPFTYTEKQMKKLNLANAESQANRYLPDQPCFYFGSEGQLSDIEHLRYNKRKLSELPFVLKQMKNTGRQKLELLAFNVEFLSLWLAVGNWSEISDYLEDAIDTEEEEEKEMSLLRQCLLLSYTTLYNNPLMLSPSITGRLLLYLDFMPLVTKFIHDADSKGLRLCALVPPHLHLETPGGELLYVINNHHDCINECIWGKSDELFVSMSSKIVVVDMQIGQVLADFQPRSMPDEDIFQHVLEVTKGENEPFFIATLKNTPWVYAFDPSDGQVLYEVRLDRESEFKEYQIDGMFSLDETHVLLWSKTHNVVIMLEASDGTIKHKYTYSAPIEFLISYNETLLVKCKGQKQLQVITGIDEDVEDKEISLRTQSDCPEVSVFVGCEGCPTWVTTDGELFALFGDIDSSASEILPFAVSLPGQSVFKPHFIKTFPHESNMVIVGACLEDHFVCLMLKVEQNACQILLQIKKRYNGVEMSENQSFLYAYSGGIIDVFALQLESHRIKAKLFVTLEAHTKPITKVLPVAEGALFMSAAEDGSLKFWNLERVQHSKLVPTFDRSKYPIRTINTITSKTACSSFALAALSSSVDAGYSLDVWNILQGQLLGNLKHNEGKLFVGHCFMSQWKEAPVYYIAAMDTMGCLFTWDVTKTFQRALHGEAAKLPHPKKLTKSVSEDFPCAILRMKVVGDGSKAVAVSRKGDIYFIDPFHQLPQKTVVQIRKAESEGDGECSKIAVTQQGQLVLFEQRQKDLVVLVIDCLTGMEISEANLSAIVDCKVKNAEYVKVTNEICILVQDGHEFIVKIYSLTDDQEVFSEKLPSAPSLEETLVVAGHYVAINCTKSLQLLDVGKRCIVLNRSTRRDITHMCFTPDGEYLLYLLNNKELYLLRNRDSAVLAWYTMYTQVTSLTTSDTGCFVIMATADRRVFTLVIADPDEPSHKKRIEMVRKANPGMDGEQVQELLEEVARDFSSEDEIDVDFDEAGSVIDMETVETMRTLSRSVSKFNAEMLKALRELDSEDNSSDSECEVSMQKDRKNTPKRSKSKSSLVKAIHQPPIIITQDLCSLQ